MDDSQLLRYNRQILLPQIGIAGQERLANATALIIGLGGLGSPVAMYLAAVGLGHLIICDSDHIDLSNLQRQILYTTADLGKIKVETARETLLTLNPSIKITPLHQRMDEDILRQTMAVVDVILDCSDNLTTRMAINQASVQAAKPLVSGAAIRFEGQIAVFRADLPDNPCYRCLYRPDQNLTETCTQSGILAPLVGIIGSMQALEAIKLLLGMGETLSSRLLLLDALNMEWYKVKLTKRPHCPVCHLK